MSNPWGVSAGAGAWALDAERADAEAEAAATAAANEPPAASFPSLREAAAAGKKKKKGTTISLSELATGTYVGPGGGARRPAASTDHKGLTLEEKIALPTGPRERSAEELDRSRLGGGFRSYGGGGYGAGGGSRMGRDDADGMGPRRGGFDDDGRRGPPRSSDLDGPSRADEAETWGANKRPMGSSMDSGRRSDRDRFPLGSGGGLGAGGGFSRADELDDWSQGKKAPTLVPSRTPSSGFGFNRDGGNSSDAGGRWGRGPALPASGERPRLVLVPPKKDPAAPSPAAEVTRTRSSVFGDARPREDVLAGKGLDWKKVDTEIDTKRNWTTSSQSSRPNSAHSSRSGSPGGSQVSAVSNNDGVKPRPKVNPFGDAKPREVVLQEKGKDWRKIDLDLEHRRIERPETNEEKALKEEIDKLKEELKVIEALMSDGSDEVSAEDAKKLSEDEKNLSDDAKKISEDAKKLSEDEKSLSEDAKKLSEDAERISEEITMREKDLEHLILELDDKVRFGARTTDVRPGSGAGRPGSGAGRPGSGAGRPGSGAGRASSIPSPALVEDSRVTATAESPHSRGNTVDAWVRPTEERWGFQGGRDKGSFSSRTSDRAVSGNRW